MSLADVLDGRTDPLLKMTVNLSQYIKITKSSQKLGAFQMYITPGPDSVCTLSFQNPGASPVLSIPLKANFSYVLCGKFDWQITDSKNKQWIVSFVDEKDMSRAICIMALVLKYEGDSLIKYDLPGQEHNGKEVGLGDRVQITYYVYTFSDFPYIDKLYLTKENTKTKIASQHLSKGFVQGMVGMTCNSSRAIFVPANLAASDAKDQGNPIDNVLFYITLKHAKYSNEQAGESEHTEIDTETEDPSESLQSQSEIENEKPKETEKPHAFISPPINESIPSLSPIPSSSTVEDQPANEKSDIMSRIRKIGGIMPGGMMGMPMQYEKRRLSFQHQDEESKKSADTSQNEDGIDASNKAKSERRQTTAAMETAQIDPAIKQQILQKHPRRLSKPEQVNPSYSEPEQQILKSQSPPKQSQPKQSQPKRGLFDEPRSAGNSEIMKRMENFERMIDKKLSIVCGSNAELVDPDVVIRGVSSLAVQLKMKSSECETMAKQLEQMKAKNSGAAASTRQFEAAKAELEEAKAIKIDLEAKVKQAEMKVKELERAELESSEKAIKNGNSYVKSMMSKVFDNMNSTFNEEGIYSGSDISDALYNLLRTEAFATMEQITENGLF